MSVCQEETPVGLPEIFSSIRPPGIVQDLFGASALQFPSPSKHSQIQQNAIIKDLFPSDVLKNKAGLLWSSTC